MLYVQPRCVPRSEASRSRAHASNTFSRAAHLEAKLLGRGLTPYASMRKHLEMQAFQLLFHTCARLSAITQNVPGCIASRDGNYFDKIRGTTRIEQPWLPPCRPKLHLSFSACNVCSTYRPTLPSTGQLPSVPLTSSPVRRSQSVTPPSCQDLKIRVLFSAF